MFARHGDSRAGTGQSAAALPHHLRCAAVVVDENPHAKVLDTMRGKCYTCIMTTTMNLRHIPVDLRNRFKAVCAEKGQTMTDAFREYMRRTVEEAARKK